MIGSTDVAVPFSRLADIIEVSKKEMDELGLFASILGHIGDGNFHESIIYNRTKKEERDKVEACVKNMVKRALDMEGTCTGEHSIGWGKKESLLWEVGPDTLSVMVRSSPISFDLAPFVCLRRQGIIIIGLANQSSFLESHQVGSGPLLDHVRTLTPPRYAVAVASGSIANGIHRNPGKIFDRPGML